MRNKYKYFQFVGGVADGSHIAVIIGTPSIRIPIPRDLRFYLIEPDQSQAYEPIKCDEYRLRRLFNPDTRQTIEIFLEVNMTIDDLNKMWERTGG